MDQYGFVKVGCASPKIKVADIDYNQQEIIKMTKENAALGVQVLVFPELCLTGITCGDLFYHPQLIDKAKMALINMIEATKDSKIIAIVGLPLIIGGNLYNVAVVTQSGKILGVVPKNSNDRYFTNGEGLTLTIELNNEIVPVSSNLLWKEKEFVFGIVFENNLSDLNSKSNYLVQHGANVILEMGSSKKTLRSEFLRKNNIRTLSWKQKAVYVDVSSNTSESTNNYVYQGKMFIAEIGEILEESNSNSNESQSISVDIDVKRMNAIRHKEKLAIVPNETIPVILETSTNFSRTYDPTPFIPKTKEELEEIIQIQVAGLVKKMEHTGITKTIIGISGGLDSTLAFLIMLRVYEILKIDLKNIIAVTMPGFGTSKQTLESAKKLMAASKVTSREISIKNACIEHLKDIGHDLKIQDVTYENAQARERTQILMDLANQEGGLVIGTGDLSELALGYCTYNGDHMSMYSLNGSIPKTLVKELVRYEAECGRYSEILKRIVDTPISPELLPTNESGNISQKTEEKIGPYILHDFFLYHFLKDFYDYEKLLYISYMTFKDTFQKEEIKKWLDVFVKRFFSQQFKRNCMPEGPNVNVSLSPNDFIMSSDSSSNIWQS